MEEFSTAIMEESSSSKVTPFFNNNIDDTNITQRLSVVLLNEFNYLSWSRVVTRHYCSQWKIKIGIHQWFNFISRYGLFRIQNMVIQILVGDVLDS